MKAKTVIERSACKTRHTDTMKIPTEERKRMKSLTKIEKARGLINHHKSIFKCPVCGGSVEVNRENSLVCGSGHSFDLSRKGYVNLLNSGRAPAYSKDLFEARRKVCEAGFYDPLIEKLTEILAEYRGCGTKPGFAVLDAGCGEGSHLCGIFRRLGAIRPEAAGDFFVGIDISKDGILIASRGDTGIIWCVSDLARLPFQDGSFDIVLNILSPANYGEFGRVLKPRGLLVKVVPGERYLAEIREALASGGSAGSGIESYSNEQVIRYFKDKMETAEIFDIRYRFRVEEQMLPHLIKMTPLTWGKGADNLLSGKGISEITAEMTILTGRIKAAAPI